MLDAPTAAGAHEFVRVGAGDDVVVAAGRTFTHVLRLEIAACFGAVAIDSGPVVAQQVLAAGQRAKCVGAGFFDCIEPIAVRNTVVVGDAGGEEQGVEPSPLVRIECPGVFDLHVVDGESI